MGIFAAIRHGFRCLATNPRLLVLAWFTNVLVALPFAWAIGGAIDRSVGRSVLHEKLVAGFDFGWFGEFSNAARGLEATFRPGLAGIGAFFDNLEAWWTGGLFTGLPLLVGLGVLYAVVWAFLLGGALERFAGATATFGASYDERPGGLLAAGGRYLGRFLGVSAVMAVAYYGVYKLARWGFGWLEEAQRDQTVESAVLVRVLVGALICVFLLMALRTVADYAKVAIVAEGRRDVFSALGAGALFVVRHPARALGLTLAWVLFGALALAVYAQVAPGVGQASWTAVVWAFLVGQMALVVRFALRLGLLAGETRLYQER
jgi:hypothetical protein